MATLRQYFDTDFNQVLNISKQILLRIGQTDFSILVRIHLDFDSNSKFISCYIPKCNKPGEVCNLLLNGIQDILAIDEGVEVLSNLPGEMLMDSKTMVFSGRIFFYCEIGLDDEELEKLSAQSKGNGIYIQFRGPDFAFERSKLEKPLAFISHDTRDKDDVARPIAIGLSKVMCPVWFDEFSLTVGDSLRESIDKGLKECKKCILILSPNYLNNLGWTKVEFNSVFTRELFENRKVILPIWYGLEKKDVYEYCPSLLDKVGIDWNLGCDEVVKRLHFAIIKDN